MDLVCFDTHVVIWGVKEQATDGQESMIPKTRAFLRHLRKENTRVLLPSIVVAELLMAIPQDLHRMLNNLLESQFLIGPFDQGAAVEFARIWQVQSEAGRVEEIRSSTGNTRAHLKADCMLVATALNSGAECIYSQDEGLTSFAKSFMPVYEIPELMEQSTLFDQ